MGLKILRAAYRGKKYVKFLISGGTATLVDLGTLYILTDFFGIWYLLSAVLAFAAAFFVSFFLQKFWTFRDNGREKMYAQMIKYLAVGLGGLIINTLGMYLAVDIAGLWYILAQIIISIFIAIGNFIFYQFIIFNRPEEKIEKKTGLKVLIATGLYPPDYRGPATLLESLPDELEKRGIKVKVLTYSSVTGKDDEAGRVIRVNINLPAALRHIIFFLKLWRLSEWADIIYATDVYSVGYFTYLMGLIKEKKYLIRFTGDSVWEAARLKGQIDDDIITFQKKKYSASMERSKNKRKKILAKAQKVIVDCQSGKRLASLIGIEENRVKIIHNGLDISRFFVNPEEIAAARKMFAAEDNTARIIISAGQLNPWKGFDGVIKIMPRLLEKLGAKLKLVIIGEGPEKEKLEKLAASLGVEKNVMFLGKVAHNRMINYLSAADLFILNSDYEGMSHLILEAMCAGQPIIASKSGGNEELIENGKEGFVVEYNNEEELFRAALELLTNTAKAEEFGKNTKEKFGRFRWENTVAETVNTLEETLS